MFSKEKGSESLIIYFSSEDDSPHFLHRLKQKTLKLGVKAVPVLVQVMKGGKYTDKKRWLATFSMGRILGSKSRDFIAKFTEHPNWVLRLAGLKTLLALGDRKSKDTYRKALEDPSLLIRYQALENIQSLKLEDCAGSVWQMIFDKRNYRGKKGKRRRTSLISKIIRTVGDLGYYQARENLLKLKANGKKYSDLLPDIEYALGKIKERQGL